MDIAKIRKKAQAQGHIQGQGQIPARIPGIPDRGQIQGDEGRPEELVRNQVDGPAQDQSTHLSGHPIDDQSGQPPGKTETQAGAVDDLLEIPAGADSDHAEPGATPEAPGTGGVDALTSGAQEDGGIAELLTFNLANEEFAFAVSEVEEIIRFQRTTFVPTMPEYVVGITSLRGKIIPVIDLRTRLALKNDGEEAMPLPQPDADGLIEGTGKIIVLAGPRGLIGAIIDKVLGVVRLPDDVILEPPAHLTEDETKFIKGVVIVEKRFISIIRSEDALNIEVG
ncbi:MAG: chemotaxis protein CheW [Thermodesulfovibrionales bacterium]